MPRNTRLLRESSFDLSSHGSFECSARDVVNRREADEIGITIKYNLLLSLSR